MSYTLSRLALGAFVVLLVVSSAGLCASARNGWVAGTANELEIMPGYGYYPAGPLEGVRVTVDGSNVTNVTDQVGYYRLSLPAGKYTLHFTKAWHEGYNATDVNVAEMDTTTVNASLIIQYGTITGTVRDEDGPVANVAVSCGGKGSSTDSAGKYAIQYVPAGKQTLTVTPAGWSPLNFSADISVNAETTKDVQLVTPSPVAVQVRDQYGNPLAGAAVTLGNLSGTTDNNGNLTLPGARPGSWNLTVKASKYETYKRPVTVKKGGDQVTVTLEKKGAAASGGGIEGTLLIAVLLLLVVVVALVAVVAIMMRRRPTVVIQAPPAYPTAPAGAPVQPHGAPAGPPPQAPPPSGTGIPPPPGAQPPAAPNMPPPPVPPGGQ